jgi:formylglycine-generating enzyme
MELSENSFIRLPAGRYRIGLDEDEIKALLYKYGPDQQEDEISPGYLYNSFPSMMVDIGGVFISKSLVTAEDFSVFVQGTSYRTEAEIEGWGWIWGKGWEKRSGISWRNPFGSSEDGIYRQNMSIMPVLQVSWNDARHYCRWLGSTSGRQIRLPGEWEWEAFGHEIGGIGKKALSMNIRTPGVLDGYAGVMKKIIDACGDVMPAGLVWEWTRDWFQAYPGGRENREFGTVYRVLKGGSIMSHEYQKLVQYRFRRCPTARSPFYGFRILMEE